MDSDDVLKHGIKKHNFTMAKALQEKLEEIEKMVSKKAGKRIKLKPSDIVNDDLLQYFLDLSNQIREKGR